MGMDFISNVTLTMKFLSNWYPQSSLFIPNIMLLIIHRRFLQCNLNVRVSLAIYIYFGSIRSTWVLWYSSRVIRYVCYKSWIGLNKASNTIKHGWLEMTLPVLIRLTTFYFINNDDVVVRMTLISHKWRSLT